MVTPTLIAAAIALAFLGCASFERAGEVHLVGDRRGYRGIGAVLLIIAFLCVGSI